jgi:tRNA (cytidine/uridine-2'-O-)-methyltransferase
MPLNVVLVTPEIPQNTGNIIRLCANTGARLHLIEPLGFDLTQKSLRRASLDYGHLANVAVHSSIDTVLDSTDLSRVFATEVDGGKSFDQVQYQENDTIVFGPESRGIPENVSSKIPAGNRIYIPMMPANRSINLSNAVAVVLYEMWRQLSFVGSEVPATDPQEYFS